MIASACFAITLSACSTGTDSTSSSAASDTPAVVAATEAAETATESTAAPASSEPVETTASAPAESAIMPDVVCMNLQAAQNKIQEAGVFFSRSEDASGEGRSQLVDSNWVVVAQTPSAGTEIGEGDAMLSAVKIGEPGNC